MQNYMQNSMQNSKNKKLVFQYNVDLLKKIIDVLKTYNYKKIQFIPLEQSFLAIVKEHENFLNLFFQKKHLLYYYSLFPALYRLWLSKKLCLCLDICFLNKKVTKNELLKIFSEELINEAIANNIIVEVNSSYQLSLSFLPYDNYIILREVNSNYDLFYSDPEKMGHPEFDNSVWVGADSIMYTRQLKKLLNKKTFNRGIEVGSGTGILSIAGSNFTKEFHAIDYNERAVAYTKLNININNSLNIKSYFSDMFKNVSGKFDLILAAPWFVDLEKSGLEEVPFILEGLDKYLDDEGVCLMTLNSYVKNGVDENIEFIKAFIKKNNYSFELHRMGYQIERERFKDWKKHNIDYVASFFAVIKKDKSFLKIHDVSIFRKIRDFTFIFLYKALNR